MFYKLKEIFEEIYDFFRYPSFINYHSLLDTIYVKWILLILWVFTGFLIVYSHTLDYGILNFFINKSAIEVILSILLLLVVVISSPVLIVALLLIVISLIIGVIVSFIGLCKTLYMIKTGEFVYKNLTKNQKEDFHALLILNLIVFFVLVWFLIEKFGNTQINSFFERLEYKEYYYANLFPNKNTASNLKVKALVQKVENTYFLYEICPIHNDVCINVGEEEFYKEDFLSDKLHLISDEDGNFVYIQLSTKRVVDK